MILVARVFADLAAAFTSSSKVVDVVSDGDIKQDWLLWHLFMYPMDIERFQILSIEKIVSF